MTVGDLTKDEADNLFATVSADMDDPTYTLETTDGGYPYMFVQDNSETDSAIMILIKEGYFVQMSVWDANYDTLTEDDTVAATTLLDTLAIVEN